MGNAALFLFTASTTPLSPLTCGEDMETSSMDVNVMLEDDTPGNTSVFQVVC